MRRDGKLVHLGSFATAEEVALCVARSPRRGSQAAAQRAAAVEGQGTLPAVPPAAILKEEGTAPPMPQPPGTHLMEVVPTMPPDAVVKVEVVVTRGGGWL